MRTTVAVAAIGVALIAIGCEPVPSLNPLVAENQAVSEPALAGTWRSPDPDEEEGFLRFEPTGERSFTITYAAEEGKTSRFEGHLVRLEGGLFLDAYPSAERRDELFAREAFFPVIPAHTFYRIEVKGDTLWLSWLDDDKLEGQLGEGKLAIAHEVVGGSGRSSFRVLTAPTAELQALVSQHPELFNEPEEFTRARE